MNFNDLTYQKINIDNESSKINTMIEAFKEATSADEQISIYMEFVTLRNILDTMTSLCYIRFSQDTTNAFYQEQMDYVDSISPELTALYATMNETLLASTFKEELEHHFGSFFFEKLSISTRIYCDAIKEDLKQENKLISEYNKLLSSAAIEFEGEIRNLSQMIPFMQHANRATRKKAFELTFGFMAAHGEAFDQLYDDLVTLRSTIAKKLGFTTFTEIGYLRMGRLDYNSTMVAAFREQVLTHIVPLANQLIERQRKRLQLDELKYYDIEYKFKTGNPIPQGDPAWIIEQGLHMYDELSKETGEFFREMYQSNLLDLVARAGKSNGGYCAYLPAYKLPFVFSNFNGTEGDITVLTHEIGHAFQYKLSSPIEINELANPAAESAEIHSMSMEFLTYPWMKDFFGPDTDKFTYSHISDGILFIPYACCVDEFQHIIYEQPKLSPTERRCTWRELERKYMPYKDYDGFDYLEKGGRWQRQAHIYEVPFYYIDYALAQLCAYQFFVHNLESKETTWASYMKLCTLGGSKPFTHLLKEINFASPFEQGTIQSVIATITSMLDGIDDLTY